MAVALPGPGQSCKIRHVFQICDMYSVGLARYVSAIYP